MKTEAILSDKNYTDLNIYFLVPEPQLQNLQGEAFPWACLGFSMSDVTEGTKNSISSELPVKLLLLFPCSVCIVVSVDMVVLAVS